MTKSHSLPVRVCAACNKPLPPPVRKGGRPASYCDVNCRNLALRHRKATLIAERNTLRRQGLRLGLRSKTAIVIERQQLEDALTTARTLEDFLRSRQTLGLQPSEIKKAAMVVQDLRKQIDQLLND